MGGKGPGEMEPGTGQGTTPQDRPLHQPPVPSRQEHRQSRGSESTGSLSTDSALQLRVGTSPPGWG